MPCAAKRLSVAAGVGVEGEAVERGTLVEFFEAPWALFRAEEEACVPCAREDPLPERPFQRSACAKTLTFKFIGVFFRNLEKCGS